MAQEQKPRWRSSIGKLMPRWRPTSDQVLWAIRVTVAVFLALIVVALLGVVLWVVLDIYINPRTATERKDLVQSFAIVVAGVVGSLSALAAVGNLYVSRKNLQQDRELGALQAYLDQMSQMLTDPHRPLQRSHLGDNLSVAARAQTLTALGRLEDGKRKGSALRFLFEAGLINNRPVISLQGADLQEADLQRADLRRADLRGAFLREANLREAILREADLRGADLRGADLQRADFREADLQRANLLEADLRDAFLQGAFLQEAILRGASLRKAYLRGAKMLRAVFQGANLPGTDLEIADFRGANLVEAILLEAHVQKADLRRADLRRADLRGAFLQGANLRGADLRGADLQRANLLEADLQGANLQRAKDLTQERLEQAKGDKNTKLPADLEIPKWWVEVQRGQA